MKSLLSFLLFLSSFPLSVEAQAADSEAENFNNFLRASDVLCKKKAKMQPAQVGRAFQIVSGTAVAGSNSYRLCRSIPCVLFVFFSMLLIKFLTVLRLLIFSKDVSNPVHMRLFLEQNGTVLDELYTS